MIETFRLKIVSKRQVTIPQRMLNLLNLSEGDELQVDVADNQICNFRSLKTVDTGLFTPEVLEKINKHEAEIRSGKGERIDVSAMRNRIKTKMGTA